MMPHPGSAAGPVGAVVRRELPLKYVETLDQWNTYKILCEGNRVKAWVNDVLVTDMINEELSEGYIALQAAGKGEISFRNITVNSSVSSQ